MIIAMGEQFSKFWLKSSWNVDPKKKFSNEGKISIHRFWALWLVENFWGANQIAQNQRMRKITLKFIFLGPGYHCNFETICFDIF